jgi:FlaG/FlaF family flagellin (archaellin)
LKPCQKRYGISSFIAVILLIGLAVTSGVVIYSFMMGNMGNLQDMDQTPIGALMVVDSTVFNDEDFTVYIRNSGDRPLQIDCAYVNEKRVQGAGYILEINGLGVDDDVIEVGSVGTVVINIPGGFSPGVSYKFKVVSEDGAQASFTRKGSLVDATVEGWLTGWSKRVMVTIDSGDIDEGLTDFPVMVHLGTSVGNDGGDVSFIFDELGGDADRRKIAVTTDDRETECYVEIEGWDDVGEEAYLWINVPSISSTEDTVLYLYYDQTQPDNMIHVGDVDSAVAENVWDNNHAFVWHLGEPDNDIHDSAGSFDGTGVNLNNYPNSVIDAGQEITGEANGVDSDNTLNIGVGDFTFEIWVRLDTVDANWHNIIGPQSESTQYSDGWWAYQGEWQYWSIALWLSTEEAITQDAWYHLAATRSGTTVNLYVNGDLKASGIDSTNFGNKQIFIGSDNMYPLNGKVDDPRISTSTRTAAWIKATYESGIDRLLTYGTEETS